jgi:hypothetical protein
MSITDKEQAFLDKFDCEFPYHDAAKAEALIFEARSISSNAAFCVLYEIVGPPASAKLPKQTQRDLLAAWIGQSSFPLAAPIADFAKQVLNGEAVTLELGLVLMRKVAAVKGQYAALAVISHLAHQVTEEAEYGLIDTLEEEARARWNRA